ncbi:glycoside hydrolase family 16 protein [Yinghuangia seranimata]|uniref:glycoside hydrolase family 16 protein n=1 Tax=Yinghuangia seranimata TaxID=408067 RepID=UPI00248B050A|nr:glycoside hydrolase family 16 protein [Yinghuangia seranimata]MDI2130554.1 glycoside hydrolase family 16 protein [Yinghuangia seranimata]
MAVIAAGTAFAATQLKDGGSRPTAGEAAQQPAPPASPPTPIPTTTHPPGILFDSFDYAGPSDPTLEAHGWEARDGGGGPGIEGTWASSGISFPQVPTAQGGKALQLQLTSDGTKAGTRQAQLATAGTKFFTGTFAARVYFTDKPATGRDGDHINQAMFLISPKGAEPAKYTELDVEYLPNGGWGAPGPKLDTTSWRTAKDGDRITHAEKKTFQGWHTVVITAMNGTVSYTVDDKVLFRSHGKEFPREPTSIQFSSWLIDLPFTGDRTWTMDVNWVYCKAGEAVPLKTIQQAVDGFYAQNTHYIDTMPKN